MPGSAAQYLELAVLGHTLGYQAMAFPSAVFIGLCTTAPNAQQGGQEVTGGGYIRQAGTFAAINMPPNSIAANAATIEFPPATADWGTIGWFEIWDAPSLGNRHYWGPLLDPADGVTPITRQILTGDIMRFSAGVLLVQAF